MIAPVAQQWEGPKPHGLGPSPIVCCPSAHPCCAGDARGSGSRAGAVSIGGVHPTPRPLPESVTDALHACSTRSAREALHPLRRDAPDQKGCNAYGSGAPPPTTSTTAGNSSPQTPTVHLGRCDTASTCSPGSEREALHPLRRAAPVTSRYTRYVAAHPLRRAAPDQKRCNAYGSGAPPPTTSTTAGNSSPQTPTVHLGRCDTASTCSRRFRARAAAPVTSRCTRYVAAHPLRRDSPDQKGCNAYGSGAPPLNNKPN